MKKNLIVTSCNEKYGDFLINSWLKSLKENVNLKEIDIIILDYGLSKKQQMDLKKEKIKIISCIKKGHITLIRFEDLKNFLKKYKYEQIFSCDGGDIIFQSDISEIFKKNKNEFRVVTEELKDPFMKNMLMQNPVSKEIKKQILDMLKNKKSINGGVIIAPREKFIDLCEFILSNVQDKSVFGTDQFLLNLYLYKEGFVDLGHRFNFIPSITTEIFKIKNGIFLDKNNEKIPIIHNAGNFFRTIENFGYGQDKNRIKIFNYHFIKKIRSVITKLRPY